MSTRKNTYVWAAIIAALLFLGGVGVYASGELVFSGWYNGTPISYFAPIAQGAQVVGVLTCDAIAPSGSRPLDPMLSVFTPDNVFIVSDDDSYTQVGCNAFSSSIVHFTATVTGDYRFVVTNLSGNNGPYTLRITGANLAGEIAANLLDGRLNNHPELDVAAPVAIYKNNGTFNIYAVNPDTGEGTLALRITYRQYLAAVVAAEESAVENYQVESIANPYTGQAIAIYLLEDGALQLNTAYADGKPYTVRWTQDGEFSHLEW